MIKKIRELNSTNPTLYWKLLSSKKPNKVRANLSDLFNYFKTQSELRKMMCLSCVGKVFTSILNERLLEIYKVLNENQAGFRKGYSSNDHLFLFKCIIDIFCHSKKKLFYAFVDYCKAFDSVERGRLVSSRNPFINEVVVNMCNNIKSCVCANGKKKLNISLHLLV